MKFANLMCVGLLASSQFVGASVLDKRVDVGPRLSTLQITQEATSGADVKSSQSATTLAVFWWAGGGIQDNSDLDKAEQAPVEPVKLVQHLWDPEWSGVQDVTDEAIFEEVQILDASEGNGEGLLTQHLWDEDWAIPESVNEVPVEEALMMDAPQVDESELVAQHLWEKESFELIEIDEVREEEALMLENASEIDESQLVAQHLWDQEWYSHPESEKFYLDEALMMDAPELNEDQMIAVYWWSGGGIEADDSSLDNTQLRQSGAPKELELAVMWWSKRFVAQHLWDEEWSSPSVLEEVVFDEALMMDAPVVDESEMVAGYIWNIARPEFAGQAQLS